MLQHGPKARVQAAEPSVWQAWERCSLLLG